MTQLVARVRLQQLKHLGDLYHAALCPCVCLRPGEEHKVCVPASSSDNMTDNIADLQQRSYTSPGHGKDGEVDCSSASHSAGTSSLCVWTSLLMFVVSSRLGLFVAAVDAVQSPLPAPHRVPGIFI